MAGWQCAGWFWGWENAQVEVNDEGGYWETGDVPELERRRDFLNEKIAELAGGLSKMESRAETPEELADEIEAFFEERRMGWE